MIKKILVAVAGRGLCEEMLNMLLDIPSFQQASITLLHVVSPEISSDTMSEKLTEAGKILAEAVTSIKLDSKQINPLLKQGDPKDIVCQVADEEDVDLIIMGSRGLGRIQAILENSVSQYVFQLTTRPMLLVKDDTYVKKLRKIMVAVDNSEASKQCLQLAISFAKDLASSQLILVHINKDISGKSSEDFSNNAEKDPVLAPAIEAVKRLGIGYRCVSGIGKPGPELCSIAEEVGADLLMLGSPDRRPNMAKSFIDLDRLLGSSLSDYVRVYANCPVLLTRTTTK